MSATLAIRNGKNALIDCSRVGRFANAEEKNASISVGESRNVLQEFTRGSISTFAGKLALVVEEGSFRNREIDEVSETVLIQLFHL